MAFLRRLFINERAATAIEYSLLTSLIAVSAVTAMAGLGDSLSVSLNILSNKAEAAKTAR
ncbi:Flp family type IVb pilin [Novosphingobium sp. FKTRR1]|uniref:Flp family type IVb pilin n=1 Tax=Novosphingobium sp. FKTRR1 TaxID=2879118 RepID=UPI001CF0BDFB|nr:Flp family type IVb pilin [Novosphingobium sp. FKTRR1]